MKKILTFYFLLQLVLGCFAFPAVRVVNLGSTNLYLAEILYYTSTGCTLGQQAGAVANASNIGACGGSALLTFNNIYYATNSTMSGYLHVMQTSAGPWVLYALNNCPQLVNGVQVITVNLGGCCEGATNFAVVKKVTNLDSVVHLFQAYWDGSGMCSQISGSPPSFTGDSGTQTLQPGQSHTFKHNISISPCGAIPTNEVTKLTVRALKGSVSATTVGEGSNSCTIFISDFEQVLVGDSELRFVPNDLADPDENSYPSNDLPGYTNSLPSFSGGSGGGPLSNNVFRAGIDSLNNNLGNQVQKIIGELGAGLSTLHQDLLGVRSDIQGQVGGGSTNGASEGTLQGVTNQLGTIVGLLTNQSGISSNEIYGALPNSTLSSSGAMAAGEAALGGALGGVEGVIGSIEGREGLMAGGAPDMTMQFMDRTINLDPNYILGSGISTACLTGFGFALSLSFLIMVSKLWFEVARTYVTAQTGGVPDLAAFILGNGGNPVGLVVAIAVPVIFITLWVYLLNHFFSYMTGAVVDALGYNAFANNLGTIAWYLLTSYFPVGLAITLAITYATLNLTMGKLVVIAGSASRFLFGK